MTQVGKVYLVGAGPGDPDLMTVKATRLLRRGDVIVYDRLIQENVLALVKASAEKIFVGKVLGRHSPEGWRSISLRTWRRRSRISGRARRALRSCSRSLIVSVGAA